MYSVILTSRKPEARRFKKWVTSDVLPTIRKTGGYSLRPAVPAFIRRYAANADRIDAGHFSVIGELVIRVWGRLEIAGYVMKDRAADGKELRPDVSVGRGFSEWLKEHHPEQANEFSFYIHTTEEWEGEARQYPRAMWPLFMEYVDEVWIPRHAEAYFRKRDPSALPYLPKLLPAPGTPRPGMMKTRTVRRKAA